MGPLRCHDAHLRWREDHLIVRRYRPLGSRSSRRLRQIRQRPATAMRRRPASGHRGSRAIRRRPHVRQRSTPVRRGPIVIDRDKTRPHLPVLAGGAGALPAAERRLTLVRGALCPGTTDSSPTCARPAALGLRVVQVSLPQPVDERPAIGTVRIDRRGAGHPGSPRRTPLARVRGAERIPLPSPDQGGNLRDAAGRTRAPGLRSSYRPSPVTGILPGPPQRACDGAVADLRSPGGWTLPATSPFNDAPELRACN